MRKLSVSEWCCAVRFNKNDDSIMTDLSTPFVVLPNSKRYWCADPFLFQKDDYYFVFFEAYDRLKRKACWDTDKLRSTQPGTFILFMKQHRIYLTLLSMKPMAIFILCLSRTCSVSFIGSNVYLFRIIGKRKKCLCTNA